MVWYPLAALISCTSVGLALDIFAFTSANGQAKLVGSSFASLGKNATYDYVVRVRDLEVETNVRLNSL